jgi:hypothetical protein
MIRLILATAFVLSSCSGSGGLPATARPTDQPTPEVTPEPTPTAWKLDVPSAKYTTQAGVGDTVAIDVTVRNKGKAASPVTRLNFSELDKHADLHRCKPSCDKEDLPGLGPSAVWFQGVKAGKSVKYHIEFVATKVGVVDWNVCLFDDEEYGDPIWCGDGSTAIR